MTPEDFEYLKENSFIFNNVKLTPEQLARLFRIYSQLEGKDHRPTGCGRCVSNVKKRVKAEYDRLSRL
jgi:hypothetical protein